MSTTLQITFHCLCFFVTDEQTRRVHVLMPPTCDCGRNRSWRWWERGTPPGTHRVRGIDQHVVRVVFPKEGGRLNADGEFAKTPEEGKSDYLEMEGWSLVLPGTGSGAVTNTFPDEVPDLSLITKRRIDRALLTDQRDPRIISRITLDGGEFQSQMGVARWKLAGKEIKMAQEVTWIVRDLPDGPFSWSRIRLTLPGELRTAADTEQLPVLEPKNNRLLIQVYHVMERDFPVFLDRKPDVTAQHFGAFYGLFDRPRRRPIPKFIRKEQTGTVGCLGARGTVE